MTVMIHNAYVTYPTVLRSPAEFVDRPKVAEFQIRQGVERIFRLKSIPCHISDGAREASFEQIARRPSVS